MAFDLDTPYSARQEAVLVAALDSFNALGVAAASIADICRRSGASVGSVYHHFGSKEGLAEALYCEGLRRFQEGYRAALAGHGQARSGVQALVRFHVAWVVEHGAWARYLLRTRADALQAATQARLTERNAVFFQDMAAWFAPHVRSGAVRPLPAGVLPALLVGPVHEWARTQLRWSDPIWDVAVADALADAIWCALRGDSVPEQISGEHDA